MAPKQGLNLGSKYAHLFFVLDIPPGTIDLTSLYSDDGTRTKGSSDFQIPDKEWLIKHGWLDEDEDDGNPFFLRYLEIFVPSG